MRQTEDRPQRDRQADYYDDEDAANDVLMMGGGGSRGARFVEPGDAYAGTITRLGASQQREYSRTGDGAPKFWPKSGRPMMQALIDLATTERPQDEESSEDGEDDGVRRIYVDSKRKREAVAEAVRAAGASRLAVGGVLRIEYTEDEPIPRGASYRAPKVYEVTYTPPAAVAVQDALAGDEGEDRPASSRRTQSTDSRPRKAVRQSRVSRRGDDED